MKVLQVNCVYKRGSTGKIVYDIHKQLENRGIETVVCYGRGKSEKENNVYKTSGEILAKYNNIKSRITGLQYGGAILGTNNLLRRIKEEKPDIVHLHCINGYFVNIYRLINYLKRKNIKTILTLHAEFMHTGNCGHAYECERWKVGCGKCPQLREATKSYVLDRTATAWKKMKKSLEGHNNMVVTCVSPWLKERATQSPIFSGKECFTILNGLDTKDIFYPRKYEYLRKKHGLKDEKIIIHVTPDFQSPLKGGQYILELAKSIENENIKILLVGNKNSKLNLPDNIINVGRIENQEELAMYYSMADITVLTSKRETFSMVCAESISCGTPVVGFKAGAPEQISIPEYSEFVEYGNGMKLKECILDFINIKDNKEIYEQAIKKASEKYSKEKMILEYMKIYTYLNNK